MRLAATLLAAAIATAATAQQAPAIAPATITLAETARVSAAPDIAEIGTGVLTTAPTAAAAITANAQRMAAVIAALRRAGLADRDIRSTGLRLEPQYRYAENQPPALTGYQAQNRVSVTIRDLAGAGRLIDMLVAQGANQLDGPDFRIADPAPLLDRARAQAVAALRARAALYAQAAGLRAGRIVSITEDTDVRQPRPVPMAMMAQAKSADTPVAPGEVELAVTVRMVFELN